jgi:hypothetical protein
MCRGRGPDLSLPVRWEEISVKAGGPVVRLRSCIGFGVLRETFLETVMSVSGCHCQVTYGTGTAAPVRVQHIVKHTFFTRLSAI